MLSLERVNVLGVSMGGRTVLELALSCPGRVGRLVLVSTSAAGRGKVTVSWPMRLLLPLRWAGLLRGKYPQPRYAYLRQRQASASYDATDRLGITARRAADLSANPSHPTCSPSRAQTNDLYDATRIRDGGRATSESVEIRSSSCCAPCSTVMQRPITRCREGRQ